MFDRNFGRGSSYFGFGNGCGDGFYGCCFIFRVGGYDVCIVWSLFGIIIILVKRKGDGIDCIF